MLVVFLVAGIAIHWRVFVAIVGMAVFACNRRMLVAELIAGFVVVEAQVFPAAVGMAIGAGDAGLSFVFVVFLVAGIAVHRGVFIAIVGVAVFARNRRMLIAKLVAGFVVIEARVFPRVLGVAISAGGAGFLLMLVVFLMAAVTIRRSLPVFRLGFMTGLALDFLRVSVRTLQREIRLLVVERLLCDGSNVFSPAFVLGVAFFAFALLLKPAVRAVLLLDILSNVFVAIEAKARLRGLIEALVALGAIFFPLGMACDHLAWHQSRFDIVGPGGAHAEHPQCEQYE